MSDDEKKRLLRKAGFYASAEPDDDATPYGPMLLGRRSACFTGT